jgi:hypothetical protein
VNLRVLRKSRKLPRVGDVFVALPPDGLYVIGRVISTTALAGPDMPAILIYIYKLRSDAKAPPEPKELRPNHLLVAPIMTNRRPWSEGYFETLVNWPLATTDILHQHCFRSSTGHFYDDMARDLDRPTEPCGKWGMHSFRTIDDEISDALGIPRSPD